MADNVAITAGTGTNIACDEATYSGDTSKIQVIRVVHVTGSEGSKTVSEVVGATGSPAAAALSTHALPATSGGCSTFHLVVAATDNATNVKASAGQVFGIDITNIHTAPIYLKFHNTAGTPTAGSGVVRTVGIQAGVSRHLTFPMGLAFGTGIAITVVTGIADNNTSAVGAAVAVLDIEYK